MSRPIVKPWGRFAVVCKVYDALFCPDPVVVTGSQRAPHIGLTGCPQAGTSGLGTQTIEKEGGVHPDTNFISPETRTAPCAPAEYGGLGRANFALRFGCPVRRGSGGLSKSAPQ